MKAAWSGVLCVVEGHLQLATAIWHICKALEKICQVKIIFHGYLHTFVSTTDCQAFYSTWFQLLYEMLQIAFSSRFFCLKYWMNERISHKFENYIQPCLIA